MFDETIICCSRCQVANLNSEASIKEHFGYKQKLGIDTRCAINVERISLTLKFLAVICVWKPLI